MTGHRGRAGLRGGKPSQSYYPCIPSRLHLCTGTRGPLSCRDVRGALRTLFLGLKAPCLSCSTPPAARRWLLLRGPGRGLPQQTCHPTPRKRAAPSRLLFVPPLGSALGRRLLPRRAVEVRGAALSLALGRLRFRPSGPLRTRALFALFLACGLRAELGGGSAPSAGECPGQGRVEPAPGREEKVEAGAPGRAVLEPALRPGGGAGGGYSERPALGDDSAVPPPGSPAPSGGGAHEDLGSWAPRRCAPGRRTAGVRVVLCEVQRGP